MGQSQPYTVLNSSEVIATAHRFADFIEEKSEDLESILLRYESYEVVQDEVGRTLDILRNLAENESYFKLRIGEVATFLPRNQPLYAFTCFVVVPALMASEVHFRIPHAMSSFFSDMIELLDIQRFFPNIFISSKQRLEFLTERSALRFDPITHASRPVTDVVIFTGTSEHASKLRHVFDRRTLFISNGSGHNPVVVASDADLDKAVQAVVTLQFYNQGQDCAAPNSILVHRSIYPAFLERLYKEVQVMKVGDYSDRSCNIGPMSDRDDLVRIQRFLCDHGSWIEPSTPGIIETRTSLVHPTIITKPRSQGGNFSEIFAPIIFLQPYVNDEDLSQYFESKEYAENAMYITLYGSSAYVNNLINREINGKIIHPNDTFLHNMHLHMPGVERGTHPYGGYGIGASSLSIGGAIIPLPTLPQRDIYEYVARPMLEGIASHEEVVLSRYSEIHKKNVQKILRLPIGSNELGASALETGPLYIDSAMFQDADTRYVEVQKDAFCHLLTSQNVAIAAELDIVEKNQIASLIELIRERNNLSEEEFKTKLYAIPKTPDATDEENRENQKDFFGIVYKLLFGKTSGPKLTIFLREAAEDSIIQLLDVI